MRSDREHCASRVAVEQEDEVDEEEEDEEEEEERRRRRGGEEEEEDQATDIKSNNPHLAGGEKGFLISGDLLVVGVLISIFPAEEQIC